MEVVALRGKTPSHETLEAIFLPSCGMNMISYKKGDIQVIDQSTQDQFDERMAGLGAIIGPHFHRRKKEILPTIPSEELFPHIARVKAKGVDDPFSHGIARYAPWTVKDLSDSKITCVLNGKDLWNGVSLAALEGQDFHMEWTSEIKDGTLTIQLSVVSSADSIVGLHHYYRLGNKKGRIFAQVQETCLDLKVKKQVKDIAVIDEKRCMIFDLDRSIDCAFYPDPDPCSGEILLDASDYKLRLSYHAPSQENCWNLYHPEGSSYVCIEPLSAKDPRHPNLTVSSITAHLKIL